ncbi:hypothetical protein EDF59_12062 [Novosphingobium sp. ST904]|nr:hypothetical protein EDF59_12062 [Novosphingobium sp. ST904]
MGDLHERSRDSLGGDHTSVSISLGAVLATTLAGVISRSLFVTVIAGVVAFLIARTLLV